MIAEIQKILARRKHSIVSQYGSKVTWFERTRYIFNEIEGILARKKGRKEGKKIGFFVENRLSMPIVDAIPLLRRSISELTEMGK
jgi:hypothetical protein